MTPEEKPRAEKPDDRPPYSTSYLNARREAIVVMVVWVVCFLWTLTYCGMFAYQDYGASPPITLGMPRWVVWGVVAPWIAAAIFTIGFGLFYVADDDLGEVADEHEPDGPPDKGD